MDASRSSFKRLMKGYLDELQNTYATSLSSGETTPELSFRPPLDELFREIPKILHVSDVEIISEPRKQAKAGRPDWRFHHSKSMGVYGYAEAKAFDPSTPINTDLFLSQVNKYRELGQTVILTDGIDFLFFYAENEKHFLVKLVEKPLRDADCWRELPINPDLLERFRQFFKHPSPRTVHDAQLMADMAKRAKAIKEDVLELIHLETGSGEDKEENNTIEALHGLKKLLETGHDPDLYENANFADMVAQLLVFGLIYAHRRVAEEHATPSDISEKLHNFWTESVRSDGSNRLRPFRALADSMASSSWKLGPLKTWYSDCILYLSYVRAKRHEGESPDYHALYEEFLKSYDPVTRIDFGSYVTPTPLSRYMVAFCEWIVKSRFKLSTMFLSRNKIVDPCTGTGTFLEELIRAIPPNVQNSVPMLAGFEILAAPYAVAQYRLSLLGREGLTGSSIAQVVLCNTLSDSVIDSKLPDAPTVGPLGARKLFHEERHEAVKLSTPPITVIIGNPPSSDAGRHINPTTYRRILDLMEDFRPPITNRTSRQNVQKQIQNDFLKFLRWACHKLPDSTPGVIAFVLPSSFLKHVSYANARKWLSHNFNWIWVLEFDYDARTGARTSNLFPTRQGRALVFCARTSAGPTSLQVKYRSILDLDKSEKVKFFSSFGNTPDYGFEIIDVVPDKYKFQSTASYHRELYEKFWQLCPKGKVEAKGEKVIFLRHCSGIKLGITAALVHPDKRILLRRARDIGNTSLSYEELRREWFEGQRKPPSARSLNASIRAETGSYLAGKDRGDSHVHRYSYRPFCSFFAFLPIPFLKKLATAGGGGARYRPEVITAYSDERNIGISVAPAPEDIGDTLHRFSSFAWYTPDNDLCARGNAHVFCLYFPEYRTSQKTWDTKNKLNISNALVDALNNSKNSEELARKAVFYVYAILCSNEYLDMFEGALFKTADEEWPRIPVPKNHQLFEELAQLGEQLARIENADDDVRPDPEIVKKFNFLKTGEIRIRKFSFDEDASSLIIETPGKKYVISGVDREIMSYKIGGYAALDEWLKWHSWSYLRRTFRHDDAEEFARLITTIRRQFQIIDRIDNAVRQLLTNPGDLL